MRMVKRLSTAIATFALLAISSAGARAQSTGGVALGYTDLGAVIGLGGIGGAGISFGGRFEKVFKALPDLGDGLLGLQVSADWWSYSQDFGTSSSSVSYIPIGVTANYHFKMENKKFDPFLGAGLGYQIISATCEIDGVDYCGGAFSSGIYFITKAGIRYFMSEKMALYADVGVGAATLNVGLVWKISGGS